MSFETVLCVFVRAAEFPQSASVACLAVGPKPAVPHISPLHKVGQKEVCLNRAGLNPESMKAPRLLLKSFHRHTVNIVCLRATCWRIHKGKLHKNGSVHRDTYFKVTPIQN